MTIIVPTPRAFKLEETLGALESKLRTQRATARAAVDGIAGYSLSEEMRRRIIEHANAALHSGPVSHGFQGRVVFASTCGDAR
jgi:hypothetical protein